MFDEAGLTSENLSELAVFRSKIYGFLSSIYMQIPDFDFVRRLISEETASFLSCLPLDIGLPREMEEGLKDLKRFIRSIMRQAVEDVCRNLSVERTRLFRGIKPGYGPPPPYESGYRNGEQTLMSRWAVAVHRKYSSAGAGIPAGCKEPPDFIGLELDFMRFLTEKEAKSWRRGDRDIASGYLDLECEFLEEHITKWVPQFCNNVIDVAELDFYLGIARMTKGFVNDDHERIREFTHMVD